MKTSYLASDNSAMARRSRGLYRFLVASPIALMLVVALVAHIPRPPYAHPASDKAYDDKVLAYRERVATVEAMGTLDQQPTATVENEARAWIAGYASGRLQPVTAAVYEDHFRDGVRNEIVREGLDLAGALVLRAEASIDAGKPELAARQALLGGETAFGLRGFDLQAHLQCLLLFRRATGLMIRVWPNVPEAAKEELRVRLRSMLVDRAEVDRLAEIDRTQLDAYLRRQKMTTLDDMGGVPRSRKKQGEGDPELSASSRGVEASNARVNELLGTKNP